MDSLNKQLVRRGNHEFVTAISGSGFTITGKPQTVVPGKKEGRMVEFDVIVKVYQNIQDLTQPQQNLGLLIAIVTQAPYQGKGTGKLAVNYEWFVKGYKYDPARQVGYPLDFNTPYYADINGAYDVLDITYYLPRKSTNVERQYRTVRVMISNNAVLGIDDIVTSLETITGATLTNPGTTQL